MLTAFNYVPMKSRVLLLCAITFMSAGCNRHLQDTELQGIFKKDFAALSNIVTEIKAAPKIGRIEWDGAVILVDGTQTNPPALTPKLFSHLKAIGQPLVVMNAGNGSQVWFCFSRRGLAVSGSMKGIVYQEMLPKRIVKNTDTSSRTNAPFTVFSLLQTNWFIFYSR